MERDMDLIREILIAIEQHHGKERIDFHTLIPRHDRDQIQYNVGLLMEAGYITGSYIRPADIARDHDQPGQRYTMVRNYITSLSASGLTWSGHEFLDSVRSPEVWNKTKKGALAAGGFTADLLKDLAKGFLKKQIEEYTGVKL